MSLYFLMSYIYIAELMMGKYMYLSPTMHILRLELFHMLFPVTIVPEKYQVHYEEGRYS